MQLSLAKTEVDPFAELDEFAAVGHENLVNLTVSMRENVEDCFDPPVCLELPHN